MSINCDHAPETIFEFGKPNAPETCVEFWEPEKRNVFSRTDVKISFPNRDHFHVELVGTNYLPIPERPRCYYIDGNFVHMQTDILRFNIKWDVMDAFGGQYLCRGGFGRAVVQEGLKADGQRLDDVVRRVLRNKRIPVDQIDNEKYFL